MQASACDRKKMGRWEEDVRVGIISGIDASGRLLGASHEMPY